MPRLGDWYKYHNANRYATSHSKRKIKPTYLKDKVWPKGDFFGMGKLYCYHGFPDRTCGKCKFSATAYKYPTTVFSSLNLQKKRYQAAQRLMQNKQKKKFNKFSYKPKPKMYKPYLSNDEYFTFRNMYR